ncbi:hypothetical protein GCM10020000_52850 [Streptomyces olivoverticillatus]
MKSNLGHTQAAVGIAGVIKMVEALTHEELPATLHVDEPSSHIDWAAGDVRLLTEARPWPRTDGAVRRAGVSAFGFSGTNAHVILEEPPARSEEAAPAAPETAAPPFTAAEGAPVPWLLTARTEEALRARAARLHEQLTEGGLADGDLSRIGHSLATTRTPFEHRAVLVGSDGDALLGALRDLADGNPAAGVEEGVVGGQAPWAGRSSSSPARAPSGSAWQASCCRPRPSSATGSRSARPPSTPTPTSRSWTCCAAPKAPPPWTASTSYSPRCGP